MSDKRRVRLDDKGLPVRKEDAALAASEECDCPRLDREDWDGVESDWSDIAFVKAATNAVLGVPLDYESARQDLRKKAAKAGLTVPEDAMLLNGEGRFRREILLEVEGADASTKAVWRPGGIAYTRMFEAKWGELKKAAQTTVKEATEKYGRKPENLWVWYLTCRHCSKERNFETLIVAHYERV